MKPALQTVQPGQSFTQPARSGANGGTRTLTLLDPADRRCDRRNPKLRRLRPAKTISQETRRLMSANPGVDLSRLENPSRAPKRGLSRGSLSDFSGLDHSVSLGSECKEVFLSGRSRCTKARMLEVGAGRIRKRCRGTIRLAGSIEPLAVNLMKRSENKGDGLRRVTGCRHIDPSARSLLRFIRSRRFISPRMIGVVSLGALPLIAKQGGCQRQAP